MIHFIVATHGPLATSLIECARMVYGELSNISSVSLTEQGGIEKFKHDFEREINSVAKNSDGVIVLCDLECGSPYNVACQYSFDRHFPVPVEVISGVNFPIVLMSADYIEQNDVEAVAEQLLLQALQTIVVAAPKELALEDEF
ncbi:PTS sugar transporter subunit IIA [Vibrio sp.]|uniref:PTS sugar transporter subunit IIA n=1 Tax=Vibrio sp. TaxID=678 RepID=UPI003D0A05D1